MRKLVVGLSVLFVITIIAFTYAQVHITTDEDMMRHETEVSGQDQEKQNSVQLAIGAKIFNTHCRTCHAKGGNNINPNMPLKGSSQLVDFETFLTFIRNPILPDGSKGSMPPYSEAQLSDKRVNELYKYITSEGGLNLKSIRPSTPRHTIPSTSPLPRR